MRAFLDLSAHISYLLVAQELNDSSIIDIIRQDVIRLEDESSIRSAVKYLLHAYGDKQRKLGPRAVIHPIRVTTMLLSVMNRPNTEDSEREKISTLHVLSALLHDKAEEIDRMSIDSDLRDELQGEFMAILGQIDNENEWLLGERIDLLTNPEDWAYSEYLGRLLDHVKEGKLDLLHVKLCDRLDSTLDVTVRLPKSEGLNFYRTIFDILFLKGRTPKDIANGEAHFTDPKQGALLLSQAFKNITFLSMIRQEKLGKKGITTVRLIDGLAVATMRVCLWVVYDIFSKHLTDPDRQREILLEVMDYSAKGYLNRVTAIEGANELDGTLLTNEVKNRADRQARMQDLYRNKELLSKTVIAFICICSAFLNDDEYSIEGITREGLNSIEDPTLVSDKID